MKKQHANRLSLIAILVVSVVPLILAILMYFMQWGVPTNRTNNGLLISPPGQWQDLNAQLMSEANYDDSGANWTLLVQLDGACDESCNTNLHTLRQVHLALGKEAHRVKRSLIVATSDGMETITSEYPNMQLVKITNADILSQGAGIYVVDPLGNIMMFYAFEQIGKPMLKDMKKLLRTSNIG